MKLIVLTLMLIGLFGCASTVNKPKVQVTDQFIVSSISLSVEQKITPEIIYHSEVEISQYVKNKINSLLKDEGLLSTSANSNSLKINMNYRRTFVAEDTPIPSDSLGYPIFDFEIEVLDGSKVLTTISKKDLAFKGGFLMNLKVIGGLLREKDDEIQFMEALSKKVIESIKSLK
jgi:hypothetical protein